MEHDLGPANGVVHAFVAPELPFDDLDVMLEAGEIPPAARREVVEHADLVASCEEGADQVRADEPAASCDQRLHRRVTLADAQALLSAGSCSDQPSASCAAAAPAAASPSNRQLAACSGMPGHDSE